MIDWTVMADGTTTVEPGRVLTPEVVAALRRVAVERRPADADLIDRLRRLQPALDALALDAEPGTPYSRRLLHVDHEVEVMLARWVPGSRCAPHDHGGSTGFVTALTGHYDERRFAW